MARKKPKSDHYNKNSSLKLAMSCWNKYNKNLVTKITSEEIIALQSLSKNDIDNKFTGKVISLSEIKKLKKYFSKRETVRIKKLLSQMKNSEFINEWLEKANTQNKISINGIFGERLAKCKESIYLKENHLGRNLLRFIDGDETFYIIQHTHAFAGIYFPSKKIIMEISYKKVKPTPLVLAQSLNREIISNFTKYLERAKNLNKQVFDGVIVSYPRPFHVFYDMLPTVHYDLTSKSRLNIPNIYSTTNGAFLSIKKLYDLPCNEVFIEADNLNEVLLQSRKFILQIAKAKSSSYNHFHDLDHLLIKKSKEQLFREEHEKRVFNHAKECYPLLWFGICGEKRSWVEQGEGISLIIQEVQKLYPNVGVVLDGLTSTIAQNEQQFRRRKAKKDIEIAKQIKSKIDPSIPFFNLIGSNSVKKITYASQIDFFLTGMGTDSMYVARICRKHGIGHINNTLNTTNHKHPYTLKIQNDYVKDVLKKKRNRKGSYLSYSIDPKIVSSLFLENLQKYLKNKS